MIDHDHERWAEAVKRLDQAAIDLAAALAERDAAVVAAVRAGVSQRETARAVGLTHPGIAKILKRST